MRYTHRRRLVPTSRGIPMPRLLTMIGMLIVMLMLMTRARDPNTWRWLTNEPLSDSTEFNDGSAGIAQSPLPGNDSTPLKTTGPTDEDPDEAEAAREEFQAITDRKELQKEEMPSYWRLLSWVEHQSLERLQQRSQKKLLFTDLVEAPDKHRGKLVHLRLHFMRSLTYATDENPAGIERLYEAWGWTDESHPWPYVVVFADRPPAMPIGPDIREEATFDGYFLKLMAYEAHDKPRFAPLLLGRIVWHPAPATTQADSKWFWPTMLAGGAILLVIIARWILTFRASTARSVATGPPSSGVSVESWLEQAEASATGNAVVDSGDVSKSGSPDSDFFPHGFDEHGDAER